MISFLVLSGVMWSSFWLYNDYSAGREASELARVIADQIVMVANMDVGYASAGITRSIELPDNLHGRAYVLAVNGSKSQVRIEIIGDSRKSSGVAFFPPSIVYYKDRMILELSGFEAIEGEEVSGRMYVREGSKLSITKRSSPKVSLLIEAVGAEDELSS